MKKIIIFALLLILTVSACVPVHQEKNVFFKENVDEYYINCYYDEIEKVLKGYQQIVYNNKEKVILEDIYLHLYPNAFEKEENTPFLPEEINQAYPMGFEPGFIDVHKLEIEGKKSDWCYADPDKNILRIKLHDPLKPGQSVAIDMNYTLKFPMCNGRFGYGEKTLKAANWYPVAAVFDSRGWNLDPYYAIGDPFYSDVSNYQVKITLPKKYEVAATGEIEDVKKVDGGYREWMVIGEHVRDFAWIASKEYKVKKKKYKGIEIRSYYFNETGGKKALEAGTKAIEVFSSLFGDYPYKTYSIAASDFFIGGMEYPNLVYIDRKLYNKNDLFSLEYVVVHETAHQWWYGVVGNNEVREAWLDEGLTEYSTVLYYQEKYGAQTGEGIFKNMIQNPYNSFRNDQQHSEGRISDSLEEYDNWQEYSSLVYCGGAMIFHRLRQLLGDEKFFEGLKVYYDTYKFENASTDDFIKIMQDVSGIQIENKMREWIF